MKKKDPSVKGDWHPAEYIGFDMLKIIFGILFLIILVYVIYTYLISPLGLIYKINKTVQLILVSVIFLIGAVLIIAKSRKRSEEQEVKMDYGI